MTPLNYSFWDRNYTRANNDLSPRDDTNEHSRHWIRMPQLTRQNYIDWVLRGRRSAAQPEAWTTKWNRLPDCIGHQIMSFIEKHPTRLPFTRHSGEQVWHSNSHYGECNLEYIRDPLRPQLPTGSTGVDGLGDIHFPCACCNTTLIRTKRQVARQRGERPEPYHREAEAGRRGCAECQDPRRYKKLWRTITTQSTSRGALNTSNPEHASNAPQTIYQVLPKKKE